MDREDKKYIESGELGCSIENVEESFKQLQNYDELYYTNSAKELLDYLDSNGYSRFVYFRPEDLYITSDNYIHDDMGKIGRRELGCTSTEYCFIYSSGHGMADNDLECDSGWIYVYPNFEIFDRDNGFKKTSLYKYLGEPMRVDEFDDIGESLTESVIDWDSEGNQLNQQQVNYFKDSKIRNDEGKLLVVYHGTDKNFDTFNAGDIGFHFGTKGQAEYVTKEKETKLRNIWDNKKSDEEIPELKDIHVDAYYLNIKNPALMYDFGPTGPYSIAFWWWSQSFDNYGHIFEFDMTEDELAQINKVFFENGGRTYGTGNEETDITDDYTASDCDQCQDKFLVYNSPEAKLLRELLKKRGYDGIYYYNNFEDADESNDLSFIAFEPNQIKRISNWEPTSANNINEDDEDVISAKEIYKEIITKSQEEIISICNLDKFHDTITKDAGPAFILQDGRYIYVKDYGFNTHTDFARMLLERYAKAAYPDKHVTELFVWSEDTVEGLLDTGWIRVNTGSSAVDKRFYCVLPGQYQFTPTSKQFDSLLNYFDLNAGNYVFVYLGVGGFKFDLKSQTTDDLIKDIKRYYKFGTIQEDLLSTLKTNLSSYKYDTRTKGWHNQYGDAITDFDDDWEPELGDWYYENDTHIFDDGKARLECWIDEENKVFTITVLWKRNNSQGEATKLIRKVLELVPEDWKIEINNDINKGYWKHIFDKYFPNRTYSDVYESLNDVEQQFYDKIGDYFYHATHKRNVDSILKHGLNKEVWLGVTPEDCIDYVKFNHKWKDDDIALFKIKKDSIKDDNLHFPVSGWGSLVGDAFYDGSISADKLELVEGVSNEFDSIVKTELDALNKWLDKYGFEVELVTDKETLDEIDWSSQYGDEAVGMFLADIQDNASVFPIALNKKVISKLCKDKDDLIRGIKGTLWHEAGHGIYRFLEDIMDMPEDEEDCVEEFARYREDSELFNILQDYMKQDESLKEEVDDRDVYYRGYDSRYGVFDSSNEYGQLYTWVTDEPEYALEYAENNEYGKVAKVRITCSDDEIGGVLDLPEDVDYYDPGDEEFQECILDQGLKGYGFEAGDYDDYCICISKDCVEVIDPDVEVEVEEESLKESVIPLKDCPTDIITGTVDFTQYVKNNINNIDLRVFYDTDKDWYLVAPAYNSIHDDIIEDAINAGYYDAKNYDAEFTGYDLTKLSEFASYIHKQGKPFVICTDIENPEDIYPHQYKLDIEGTIIYVLSYFDLRGLDFIKDNLVEVLKEDFVNESKADQQKFIDKFGEQRWNLFNTLKARLVNKDIYYWLKKTEDELDDELRRVASQKTNKEVRSEAKSGATLIDEDKNWKAYRIDTYEAAKYYGYGTQWCISSAENAVNIFDIYGETSEAAIQDLEDSYPVVKVLSIYNSGNNYWEIEAELEPYYYFDEYSENSNIYFFIAKPENKECFESDQWCKVAYVPETSTFYDAEDMDYEPSNHGSNFKALPQSLQDFYKKRMGLFESLSLNESKQDIEKFRQWAGDELANRFFAVKNRLKGELKDIYYWISLEKKLGPNKEVAHQNVLDSLEYAISDVEVTPTKKERQELAKNGSEKIYEDERWLVLKINSFEASVKYGKHTQWCITGTNSGMDGGRSDWNYHSDNDMYFFIDKQKDTKYALEFKDMHNWCLYNDQDYVEVGEGDIAQEAVNVLGDPWSTEYDTHYPAFPKIEGLPDLQQAYRDVIAEEGADDKSIKVESLNEDLNVLDALDKEFGQEEVYMWSTYILPNGHFLNPDNSNWWDEVGYDPQYEHCDFEGWAYDKGYNLSDIYNNCIKMNVTYPYLSMPDKARPTQEQLNAIRKILDRKDLFEPEGTFYWYDIFPEEKVNNKGANLLGVYTPVGDELFDLDVNDADDIIRAINQAYIRGGFFTESLNESKADWEKFRQWCYTLDQNDELYNWFISLQKRLGDLKDIYWWMKNSTPEKLYDYLHEIQSNPSKKQKEKNAKEGAKLLYDANGWKVYEITTYEAAVKYGKNTTWCISGNYDSELGYDYWSDYADNKVIFYIKGNEKWAVIVDGSYFTIWDELDNKVAYIPGAPQVDGLPDVSKYQEDTVRAIVQLYNVKPSDIEDIKNALDDSELSEFFYDYDTREAYEVVLKDGSTRFMYWDGPQGYFMDVTDEMKEWAEEYM